MKQLWICVLVLLSGCFQAQAQELALLGAGTNAVVLPTLDKHSAGNYCSSNCTSETATLNASTGSHVFVWIAFCASVSCADIATVSNCATIASVADGTNTFALVGTSDSVEPIVGASFVSLCTYEINSAAGGTLTITASSSPTTLYYISVFWASFLHTAAGPHDQFGAFQVSSASTTTRTVTTSGNISTSNELLVSAWVRSVHTMVAVSGMSIDTGMLFGQGLTEYEIGGIAGSTASETANAGTAEASSITALIATIP